MAGLTNEDGKSPECELKPYYIQIGNIINWIDTIVTLLIPMFLILIMNISIAKVVFRSHKWRSPHERTFQTERISFHHVGSQVKNSQKECFSQEAEILRISEQHLHKKFGSGVFQHLDAIDLRRLLFET